MRRRAPHRDREEFWALRDVSFTVEPGEVLGVIGPNGSGKSTLLKLLTGILRPDRGRIGVPGRAGALIELAAGFHPDLTGRENVFLQGAVMGMRRREIEERFDDIVDFSGIGPFIDTPIKRYSSGMNARLGFSIAAHLDPDVLLVDEVLSVGDLAFQRKAEERLRQVVQRDIPVVIVSHRMDSIAKLCDHALLLSGGEIAFAGPSKAAVSAYVDGAHLAPKRADEGAIELESVVATSEGPFDAGDALRLVVTGTVRRSPADAVVAVRLWAMPGEELLCVVHTDGCGARLPDRGPFSLEVDLRLNLADGVYRLQPCVLSFDPYREWVRGGSVVVEVTGSRTAFGRVGLDPRMRVRADG